MSKNILQEIKANLDSWVGKKVCLRANRGRRKILSKEGILEQTYPHIFVAKVDKGGHPHRVSYSYADIITETVELTIKDKDIRIGSLDV